MQILLDRRNIHNSTGALQKNIVPTVEWFDHKHIMCILIAIVPFLLVSLFPSLLLLIYPTRLYQYLSRFLSARKRLAITAFAEAIHSCFKDGLNGTTDYRAFGAINLLFLLPVVPIMDFLSSLVGYSENTLSLIFVVLILCVVSYIKPCKQNIANISIIYHFVLYLIRTLVYSIWWNTSVETKTLEVTLIATGLASHLVVALWASSILTRLAVRKLRFGGCCYTSLALSNVPEKVTLGFRRRHGSYQELHDEASAE